MPLIRNQRLSSLIWIAAGFLVCLLTFWYPLFLQEQFDSSVPNRIGIIVVGSAAFTFLAALWSVGHFIYLLRISRGHFNSPTVALIMVALLLLLGSVLPAAQLLRKLWF